MDRLKEILMEAYATIKANQDSSHEAVDPLLVEAMQKYATEVARHNLERAAEKAKILVSNGETHLDVKSYTLDDGIRFSPDYNRILSTPINTDL